MKIETTVIFEEKFDQELNDLYEKSTFEENEAALKRFEQFIKSEVEKLFEAKNVKVTCTYVQE